jgi:hypothetical protein
MARARIHEMPLALMDSPRSMRGGDTALSPERKSALPPGAAKEGVRGGTSKPRAKAAAKPYVLARGDEVTPPKAASTMGSPTWTGYRGIVDAVCDLAGVAA